MSESQRVRFGVRRAVALTRPRVRVITRTKWAVNMTKKYRAVSWAMVLKSPTTLRPDRFDFFAKYTINRNARESDGTRIVRRIRLYKGDDHGP